MAKKVLVLFAHPEQPSSEVNIPLFTSLSKIDGVTAVDLYAKYPRFRIDVEKEQQRLLEHDIIIFQFPLYWYSSPAILKEWQDLVLEYGFAYGKQGDKLAGKSLLIITSAGAQQDAYQTEGLNQYPLRELLRPFEQTAHLCHMHYLPPLVLFGSRTALEDLRIDGHIKRATSLIQGLQQNRLDHHVLSQFDLSNDYFQDNLQNNETLR